MHRYPWALRPKRERKRVSTGGLVDPWWAFDLVLVIRGDGASGTDPATV